MAFLVVAGLAIVGFFVLGKKLPADPGDICARAAEAMAGRPTLVLSEDSLGNGETEVVGVAGGVEFTCTVRGDQIVLMQVGSPEGR